MKRRQVAFVLSGGGSLGAIQVGMLKGLLEEGIRPDFLVGTSVGAVNAAWIAGRPEADGAAQLSAIWAGIRRQDIFPISPLCSARGILGHTNHVISNDNLKGVLQSHLLYERLEEAAIPVHVIVTDLKSGEAVTLSSGPAIPALLASTAIPGVFPPVTIGKREFVDGGVANHTPVTAAIELGATEIYVLPVGYNWLREGPNGALGMALQALARIIEQRLAAEVVANQGLANIKVIPAFDVPHVSPADFSQSKELIRRAYRATRRFLGQTSSDLQPRSVGLSPARVEAA